MHCCGQSNCHSNSKLGRSRTSYPKKFIEKMPCWCRFLPK